MNMTKEQVQAALGAGLALTNPESEAPIPMKHAAGATILHQLLLAIASGQVQLNSAPTDAPPADPKAKTPRKKAAARRKVAKKSKVANRKKK